MLTSLALLSVLLNACFYEKTLVIRNSEGLIEFAKNVSSGASYEGTTVALDADIDFSGSLAAEFAPIGTEESDFSGEFDGRGHVISNLAVKGSHAFAGLFGYMGVASIKNVVLDESCTIAISGSSEASYVGAIAGYCASNASQCAIENAVNMASVTFTGKSSEASAHIGGIAGMLAAEYDSAVVKNCINYGAISHQGTSSAVFVGGVVGHSQQATVLNCANYGAITNSGSLSEESYFGGITGFSDHTTAENYLNAGQISAEAANAFAGALTGFAGAGCSFTQCLWTKTTLVDDAYGKNSSSVVISVSSIAEMSEVTLEHLNQYSEEKKLGRWVMLRLNGGRIRGFESGETLIVTQRNFPVPAKEDHTFDFWCLDEECTKIYDPATTSLEGVDQLYAAWTINSYLLTFDFDNGSKLENFFKYEEDIKYPQSPTRRGWIFLEWCTEDKEICSPVTMPKMNITLHPQWAQASYSSASSSSSSSSSSRVESDSKVSSSYSSESSESSEGSESKGKEKEKTSWEKLFTVQNIIMIGVAVIVFIIILVVVIATIVVSTKKNRKKSYNVSMKKPLISDLKEEYY